MGLTNISNTVYASGTEGDLYIIGMNQTSTIFMFIEVGGEPAGIEINMVDATAEDQSFEYRIPLCSFSATLQVLESNQIEGIIAGMLKTPEREQSFDFYEAYFSIDNQVVISNRSKDIKEETIHRLFPLFISINDSLIDEELFQNEHHK